MTLTRPLVLLGMMASGKSSVATWLASNLRLRVRSLDEEVVALAGKPIPDIFAQDGEGTFRDLESWALAGAVAPGSPPAVVDTGGGVVDRAANRAALIASDTDRCFLDVGASTLFARIGDATTRPMLDRDDPEISLAEISSGRERFYREVATYVVQVGADEGVDVTAGRVIGGVAA